MSWMDKLSQIVFGSKKPTSKGSEQPKSQSKPEKQSIRRSPNAASSPAVDRSIPEIGWKTQFDGVSINAASVQVIIGLDFGTAFSKVVVSGEGQRYGVPINLANPGANKYLLATQIYENHNGHYSLDRNSKDGSVFRDLKMRIIEDKFDNDSIVNTVAYIALVLQKTRAWILSHKKAVFGSRKLIWEINVGLPTANFTDEKLTALYRGLVSEAWYSSTNQGNLTRSQVQEAINLVHKEKIRCLHPDMINAFPEFVAQIGGYISSPQRRSGIHALVDVGAGTVDATVFNVHRRDDENIHPIFAQSVERLGTNYLIRHRCSALNKSSEPFNRSLDRVPPRDKFANIFGVNIEELKSIDSKFGSQVSQQITSQIEFTRNEMAPLQGEWEEGVPLMLSGGGSNVDIYKDVASKLTEMNTGYQLRQHLLPIPSDLDAPDLPDSEMHRLSVAYGLSFDALNIGEITYPEPFREEEPEPIPLTTCPSCNGSGGLHMPCTRCGGSGFL